MPWLGKTDEPARPNAPAAPAERKPDPGPSPAASAPKPAPPAKASIGKSLHIKGELSGQEDLQIDGTVDGRVTLDGHDVTIGPSGRVQAGIRAKSVVVGGQMRGNVVAEAKFEIAATGTMLGDVTAPRVVLADGAKFKGSIDMDARSGAGASVASASSRPAEPSKSSGRSPEPVRAKEV